jgi:hypothetical protein
MVALLAVLMVATKAVVKAVLTAVCNNEVGKMLWGTIG